MLEQNLQSLLAQKQTIQMEQSEIENALEELSQKPEEVYKVLSGIMIKSSAEKILEELKEKKKLFDLRITSIEKQENLIESKANTLREEISKVLETANKKNK